MERITLRYESGTEDNVLKDVEIILTEDLNIYDFVEELKKFALVIGYTPKSVNAGFNSDD